MNVRRRFPLLALLAAALAAAAPALPATAQTQSGSSSQPDLVPVMIWTAVAATVSMLVLGLGYLYRRAHGAKDELIPKTVDPYYAQVGEAEKHSTGELHPEMAHDGAGMHAAEPSAHDQAAVIQPELTAPNPTGIVHDPPVGAEALGPGTGTVHH